MGCTLELFAVYLFLQSTHFECTCRIIYIYWGYGDVIVRPLGKLHTLDTLKMLQNFSNKQQAYVSIKSWYSHFSITAVAKRIQTQITLALLKWGHFELR